jgi:eukaryotic-like serine/threonine-protein kinase
MLLNKITSQYEIVGQLSTGGTAIVYQGVDLHTGFPVAVKELRTGFRNNEFVRKKFKEEANRYLYLNHPNIVRLVDFIDGGEAVYLVMEFVDGVNLEDYINKVSGPLPESVTAAMMCEVLDAIAYAHSQDVIHLDLKPLNIMISNSGEIKVLDFGIAHTLQDGNPEKIMGSPVYMSPEQISGKAVSTLSDIYSLGVTLFQLLTTQTPFPNATGRDDVFKAVMQEQIADVRNIRNDLSPTIAAIVRKATMKQPEHRFQTCADFKNALGPLI